MFVKVSKRSEKTRPTGFYVQLRSQNFEKNCQLDRLLTFSKDFCITVWQTVYIFRQKSKSLQKCQYKCERPRVPVFRYGYTVKIPSKIWQLSCLLTLFKDFCIMMWQTVYIFRQKSKCLQKCHHSQKRLRVPVFI